MQTDRLSVRPSGHTLDRMTFPEAIVHVGVVLATARGINPEQTKALKREASRIWDAYGVHVTWFDGRGDCSYDEPSREPVDRLLVVVTGADDVATPALGSVSFSNGMPGETIHLSYQALSRLVSAASIGMWTVDALPLPLRDRIIGNALGRVLAHEIGHVLLALPSHDRSGLMRPAFTPSDLVASDGDALRLPRATAQRLFVTTRAFRDRASASARTPER